MAHLTEEVLRDTGSDGYKIVRRSEIAHDGTVVRSWIEVLCPNGDRKPFDSIDGAEAFIQSILDEPDDDDGPPPRPRSGPRP
jgi:hypothetical protein